MNKSHFPKEIFCAGAFFGLHVLLRTLFLATNGEIMKSSKRKTSHVQ